MNARSLWLTPQTTTPYATTIIDVKNGPIVVEVGVPIIGIMDDAFFKYVGDVSLGNANDRVGCIIMPQALHRSWLHRKLAKGRSMRLQQQIAKATC